MDNKSKDLEILLGEPKRAIRSMALAFIFAMAVIEVNQFVDTFWVSGLGADASSAVATVTPIYGLMMCAGLGIGVGATTSIAFRLGQGEHAKANSLAANSLTLTAFIAVISSVIIAITAKPVIELMGAGSIMDLSFDYLIPFILMSPALLCSSVLGAVLRAEGAAKKSTIVQISAAVFNIILDPVMIYGLDLGVFGAGLSTSVSALLSLLIGLWWYYKDRMIVKLTRESAKVDREAMKEVLNVGAPKTGQTLISNFTDLVQRVFLIVAGGTNAVILYNFTWRYIGLVNLPGRACDSAMIPVCSAAYGQSDMVKMRTAYHYTAKIVLLFGIASMIALFVFAEPLITILTLEETMAALRPEFVWTLQVSVLLIPFSALMGIGASMLQALKKAKVPMYFYMFWGFLKLGMYAVAAYGFNSYEWIIYSMVIVHVFGGIALMYMAEKQYRKVAAAIAAAA